jgi:hypothetical protein
MAEQKRTCTIPGCNNPLTLGSLIACEAHQPAIRPKYVFEFFVYDTPATSIGMAAIMDGYDRQKCKE